MVSVLVLYQVAFKTTTFALSSVRVNVILNKPSDVNNLLNNKHLHK